LSFSYLSISLFYGITEVIAQDYNNEQIVKLFGKQVEKLGERKVEVLKETLAQKTQLQQRMDQFREQNKNLQAELDQTIDSMEARFADMSNVVEYDAERLEKKYLNTSTMKKGDIPCLTERTSIVACYAGKKDSAACDSFIQALEECVSNTIRE
jgi:cell shape-determining protein MreC